MSAVFAKPTVFQVGNSQILTDDENKLIVYTGTDEDLCTEMFKVELFGVRPSGVTIELKIDSSGVGVPGNNFLAILEHLI